MPALLRSLERMVPGMKAYSSACCVTTTAGAAVDCADLGDLLLHRSLRLLLRPLCRLGLLRCHRRHLHSLLRHLIFRRGGMLRASGALTIRPGRFG